jgi:tyrosine phenol-lyase
MPIPIPRHEPHKIKTVRLISFPSLEERKRHLADAQFNVFHLTPTQVNFDMVSHGTSAMSQEQIAGQLVGDEAYAGARNFENLRRAVQNCLGHTYVCPTHNLLGCIQLVVTGLVPEAAGIATNAGSLSDTLSPRGIPVHGVRTLHDSVFTGDFDLARLEALLADTPVGILWLQAFADGMHPVSLANLQAARATAERRGMRLVLDGSRVIENAWYIQRHEPGQSDRAVAEIVKQMVKTAHVLALDGGQDPKAPTGGILSTDNPVDHERFINDVVLYEGLHTYGGMSGRTMEVLARGIEEMCDEAEVQWVMRVTEQFTEALRAKGIPLERGSDGAYLDAERFLPRIGRHPAHALAAALYLTSGLRACPSGLVGSPYLPVQIPRLAMTTWQLGQVVDAIANVYRQRDRVAPLEVQASGRWNDQLRFRSVFADLAPYEFDCYPFVTHTIEPIPETSREQRERAVREAGYNTFLLRSAEVTIDLLTDSGTSAMSTDQWAAYDSARATSATSDAYRTFVRTFREIYGYEHIIPTHQGRAAEHILSQILIRPGQLVPGNMYFTTTKAHQELAGGVFVDVIVDEAHNPESDFPWKGNIDLSKLGGWVEREGSRRIAYISFEHCVNMAGGQPVSMDNMREVYAYCSANQIPVLYDATRAVENAYFIQKRDPRYRATHIRDILREMMLYGDGCTVSGKKDFLVNIGGLLAFKDNAEWKERAEELLRVYEGGIADGGLAPADLAAMARGAEEMLDDRYIRTRVEQAGFLASRLVEGGVPIVMPPGSHAIFIDARRFLSHLDQDEYPSQRLAAEIYVETGVRVMERGNVSKGRNPDTGENYRPALELVRLTIPRRVYTNDHMRAVADGIIRLYARRETIGGLRFTYEPPQLRFFQGRFAPVEKSTAPAADAIRLGPTANSAHLDQVAPGARKR